MRTVSETRVPLPEASPAVQQAHFGLTEWALLAAVASMWGSSFVFIEAALRDFSPPLIAALRVVFGIGTLAWFEKARVPIPRHEWRSIFLLGFFWMAAPFLLFPIAQQWIDSSLAGMINGGVPIFAAVVAALIVRALPSARQVIGLVVGFVGVLTVSWPASQGATASALGVVLVLLATMSYGFAINIAVPLQRKYGSLPVLLRAQLVALALTAIPGLVALGDSTFSWRALLATVPLGCLGTGLAFLGMTTLAGRVGAARAAVTVYFIPVVAIVLGALLLDEEIAPLSLVGTAMIILGAVLASRHDRVDVPRPPLSVAATR